MITEKEIHHMLGVARRCYQLAKENNYSEEICRDCFVMGFLSNIGREFTDSNVNHAQVSAEILEHMYGSFENIIDSIAHHSDCSYLKENSSLRLQLLNQAIMTTNSDGEIISVQERLNEIKDKYGMVSPEYSNAMMLVENQAINDDIKELVV